MSDDTDKKEGAEVVSIEDARKKNEAATAEPAAPNAVSNFMEPVMAAIAKQLAGMADPDGNVNLGGADEVARAKTAALLKGLGEGLGQALAQAFGKWANKIEFKIDTNAAPADPAQPPTAPAPGPEKKN